MSERFVVDASVAAKWLFEEEDSALAASLREHLLMAPSLLWLECGSVIWNRVIRGVLAPAAVPEILACLNAAPVERVPMETRIERVLRIAVQLRHPVYDCAYLALAVMRDLRMVTPISASAVSSRTIRASPATSCCSAGSLISPVLDVG